MQVRVHAYKGVCLCSCPKVYAFWSPIEILQPCTSLLTLTSFPDMTLTRKDDDQVLLLTNPVGNRKAIFPIRLTQPTKVWQRYFDNNDKAALSPRLNLHVDTTGKATRERTSTER